jgi:hypothetical protein
MYTQELVFKRLINTGTMVLKTRQRDRQNSLVLTSLGFFRAYQVIFTNYWSLESDEMSPNSPSLDLEIREHIKTVMWPPWRFMFTGGVLKIV